MPEVNLAELPPEQAILIMAENRAIRLSLECPKLSTATLAVIMEVTAANAELGVARDPLKAALAHQKRMTKFSQLKDIMIRWDELVSDELNEKKEATDAAV